MSEQVDKRADTTRLQILRAASHQFAHRPYSVVSLDDILADAQVTKGAMYFHFRSKHSLALAIIDHWSEYAVDALTELRAQRLAGSETLVAVSYLVAAADIGDDLARASFNLLESIGRTDRAQASIVESWIRTVAEIAAVAVTDGDVQPERDPTDIARMLVALYLGMRRVSDLDEPQRFLTDLGTAWTMALPGFIHPARLDYLDQFVRRRTAHAMKTADAQLDRL